MTCPITMTRIANGHGRVRPSNKDGSRAVPEGDSEMVNLKDFEERVVIKRVIRAATKIDIFGEWSTVWA